ncbi:MAG: hypothetical protein ABEJ60_06425 [Halodesulfurarchaeum sp.]
MTERLAHDHPTIETIPAKLARRGRTTRPTVRVQGDLEVEPGSLVRLMLDGTEYRAPVERREDGTPVFRRAASSPAVARDPAPAENALVEWVESTGLGMGRTVHVDVVEPGFRYGLRAPGESAVYPSGRPDDSLASIAENLDGQISDTR